MEIIKVILTSLLSAAVLFLLAKIMGHKQISQLDFFDYITGITIGSIAAELATELEDPLKPLIAMVVYGVIAVLLSILTNKFPRTRKYINGTPTILMHNGKYQTLALFLRVIIHSSRTFNFTHRAQRCFFRITTDFPICVHQAVIVIGL